MLKTANSYLFKLWVTMHKKRFSRSLGVVSTRFRIQERLEEDPSVQEPPFIPGI